MTALEILVDVAATVGWFTLIRDWHRGRRARRRTGPPPGALCECGHPTYDHDRRKGSCRERVCPRSGNWHECRCDRFVEGAPQTREEAQRLALERDREARLPDAAVPASPLDRVRLALTPRRARQLTRAPDCPVCGAAAGEACDAGLHG